MQLIVPDLIKAYMKKQDTIDRLESFLTENQLTIEEYKELD